MKKIIAAIISVCIMAFSFASCGEGTTKTAKIRLNEVTHSVFYAPLYIALENGFFKDEGLEIELTNGGGADKVMTALLSGGADIGLMGVEASIYVHNEGKKDAPVVFGQLTKRDGSFLVSRNPEPDFKWSDLEGKEIIAGRTGGVPAMTFEYVVNKYGLYNGKNVTLNNDIAFNLMGPAFESGTGDYTTLFEPTASEYERAGKGYIVASVGKESGEIPYTAFTALKSYLDKNGETVEKFIKAMYKAIKYLNETDETTVAESLLKQFPDTSLNSISTALKSYKQIDAWTTDMTMSKTAFENLQNVMENAGELDKRANYEDIAYNEYAAKFYREIFG
ncbi:MAG: ABC transporter substrate-binding protein [Clostridia bacterium]|nr:ABC transporter substrate-binding protein [Clostridia bacterium]